MLPLFAILLVVLASPALADFAYVLLPVTASLTPVPGANGSLWTTEIVARNIGTEKVQFLFNDCGTQVCPEPYLELPPNTTTRLVYNFPDGATALMRAFNGPVNVVFSVRVRDLSRQAETWGTEIPVVREENASTSTVHLLNIPSTPDFRTTLRIYDFSNRDGRSFRVTVHPLEGNEVLTERVISTGHLEGRGITAASVSDLLTGITMTPVRLEIAPMSQDSRFFAFVSVTNNTTQHVTVVVQRP
jgi:hypothetical protein